MGTQAQLTGLIPTGVAGQWIGRISGTNTGSVRIDIDHDRPSTAAIYVADSALPFAVTGDVVPTQPGTYEVHLRDFLPSVAAPLTVTMPSEGSAKLTVRNGVQMDGSWETNVNTRGQISASLVDAPASENADWVMRWKEFFAWAGETDLAGTIFRGQAQSDLPLRTSFHRCGRRNFRRYVTEDVPTLRRLLESQLNSTFPEQDSRETGCLLALAQHHGYPTPLLDWTQSPFIAAYFAFRDCLRTWNAEPSDRHVRIFVFNCNQWRWGSSAEVAWEETQFRLAPLNLAARYNPRAVPQQSVLLFSNLVDIEQFVKWEEGQSARRHMYRIDIPVSDCRIAMHQLALMGITAGSMFPGIDGACRSLAERHF